MTTPVLVTAGLALLFLLSWIWRPRPAAAEPGEWALLGAFVLLGAWALWFGVYFPDTEPAPLRFWKPTILYWTLAAVMVIAPLLRWGYPVKAILGTYFTLSTREWLWLNRILALLYVLLGGINLFVAANASEANWEGFKFSCLMNLLFLILFRLNFVWLPILRGITLYLYRQATVAYRFLSGLI